MDSFGGLVEHIPEEHNNHKEYVEKLKDEYYSPENSNKFKEIQS